MHTPDCEKPGLTEREQSRVAEQQIESEREHRKDQDVHHEVYRVASGDPWQHEERSDEQHDRDARCSGGAWAHAMRVTGQTGPAGARAAPLP